MRNSDRLLGKYAKIRSLINFMTEYSVSRYNSILNSVLSPTDAGVPSLAFSVSEINIMVSDALTASLPGILSVEGEISNLSIAASGHRYFSLKDATSTISCALFRGAAGRISRDILHQLKSGDKVVVKASISVFRPRGHYQLIIKNIEPAGFGALAKAFAELKQKLDVAGYTAAERKRPIPTWPTSLAVVTSAGGAAVRDVLTTLKRRAAFIPVSIYPTLVQGQNAPQQIVQALQDANGDATASVILLVRGGGSPEDLQAFNDESVAMAVVNSRLPVVTGVGHETDFTLVDFVSDARAPTPTAAAEWVSPDKQALSVALEKHCRRLNGAIINLFAKYRQHLSHQSRRLSVQHPLRGLQQQSQRLDELSERLQRLLLQRLANQRQQLTRQHRQLLSDSPQYKLNHSQVQLARQHVALSQAIKRRLDSGQQQLKGLRARLTLLSPLGVLNRGYVLAFHESGHLLRHAKAAQTGDNLRIRLADGELRVQVQTRSLKNLSES